MGFSFRKRIKLFKGVNMNIGKKGVGFSFGGKIFGLSFGPKRKPTARVSLPGTGIRYTTTIGKKSKK